MSDASEKMWHDARLSIEAKAVLGFFQSRPAAEIRVADARETLRVGADRMKRAMRELVAAGYVELSGGRAGAGSYYILGADSAVKSAAVSTLEKLPWSEISPRSCATSPAQSGGAK